MPHERETNATADRLSRMAAIRNYMTRQAPHFVCPSSGRVMVSALVDAVANEFGLFEESPNGKLCRPEGLFFIANEVAALHERGHLDEHVSRERSAEHRIRDAARERRRGR